MRAPATARRQPAGAQRLRRIDWMQVGGRAALSVRRWSPWRRGRRVRWRAGAAVCIGFAVRGRRCCTWRRLRAGARRRAARVGAVVSAASCGHRSAPSRQSDARHPARRRPRQLFRSRRPRAAEQPDRGVLGRAWIAAAPTCSSSTSSAIRRRACGRFSASAQDPGATPPRLMPVLRARVTGGARQRREPRELQRRARPRLARARVRRSPIATISNRTSSIVDREVLDGPSPRAGGASRPKSRSRRASTSASTSRRRRDAVRHPRPRSRRRG